MAAEFESLPPLYARWADALLGAPIPKESRATCETCAMCKPAGAPPRRGERYFAPDTKCCTYTPALPNFLVGRILADDDPAMADGRASVRRRIDAGAAVTPLGLGRSAISALLYERTSSFGRNRDLICPHFIDDGARCGIWRHREAVCATWFCKHVRGEVGNTFWRGALLRLLSELQTSLSKWCALELDIGVEALARLIGSPAWTGARESLDPTPGDAANARLWGPWSGREPEFYVRCAERVEALSWEEVLALGGPEARALAVLARRAFARLTSAELPASLSVAEIEIAGAGAESLRVVTYSPIDPIELPSALLALLPFFDGRTTDEAVELIAGRTGVRLAPAMLLKLADFGVLKPG